MRAGLDGLRAAGQAIGLPVLLASMAEAYAAVGSIEDGLSLVNEARQLIAASGEERYAPELDRLEGELHEGRNDLDAAERCYRRAVELVEGQASRWWELRAKTSLARLYARQGRREAARRLVSEVFGRFTEGFDTADLRDARSLLDELASSARAPAATSRRRTRRAE
jgi:adenylate cyclase